MTSAGVAAHDEGWAIYVLPPGSRDLGCADLWSASLARSRRRREAAAARPIAVPRSAAGAVSAALVTAALVAPSVEVASGAKQAVRSSVADGMLKKGSRGAAVAAVQRALGIAADGVFGSQTKRAVRAFQRSRGLVADGVVGPATSAALGIGRRSGSAGRSSGGGGSTISGPKPSQAVTTAIQSKLGLAVDGVFGPQTRNAVRAFQASKGLTVDGVVGPQTLAALGLSGSPDDGSAAPAPAPAPSGNAAVAAVRSKLGAPYASAGTGPNGFDCSGLTQWAMRQAGISLPRTSYAQHGVGSPIDRGAIQPGDLVFFNTYGGGASHVGVATSSSTVISATTRGVREHSIGDSYWGSHYIGARRVS